MSTEYSAVLAIGKLFGSEEEAISFLNNTKDFLNEEDRALINKWGLEDSLSSLGLNGGILNAFTGDGFYIGFDIDTNALVASAKTFRDQWNSMFNEPAETVLEVRVN